MITINMSEFQEGAHGFDAEGRASRLMSRMAKADGSPRRCGGRPYSVILLPTEMEKAHPDVHELFFQGVRTQAHDGGRAPAGRIDFKNSLIIMTTNVGTDLIMGLSRDPMYRDNAGRAGGSSFRPELLKVFPAALLRPHRVDPVLSAVRRDARPASSAFSSAASPSGSPGEPRREGWAYGDERHRRTIVLDVPTTRIAGAATMSTTSSTNTMLPAALAANSSSVRSRRRSRRRPNGYRSRTEISPTLGAKACPAKGAKPALSAGKKVGNKCAVLAGSRRTGASIG